MFSICEFCFGGFTFNKFKFFILLVCVLKNRIESIKKALVISASVTDHLKIYSFFGINSRASPFIQCRFPVVFFGPSSKECPK